MPSGASAARLVHTIAPVYDARSRVLLLGTFPSPKSRASGFFYGHPQNRFWRVMAVVLDVPAPRSNEEKAALMLSRRIALWDVLQSCGITGASDASIKDPKPNDLSPILRAGDIRAIFTTGKKAFDLYEKYIKSATGIPAAALPSTSPANCACSFDRLCEAYRVILPYLED
ncbi:DNA-deoxyinosine glycosylase [Anaerotruncus colihominis]|uniref:DNA-deoxyinosine glycosylase n=1 Tax=Anaerotruncus colihominis TaxID=169435 RepID=UPI0029428F4E|nr:DNA-deoxyinosine glycosylase [Anaerotruncus colihominis]